MRRVGAALLGGLVGLGIAVALGIVGGVVASSAATVEAPTMSAGKATRLAVGISTAMNCGAAASILLVPVGAVVMVRRRRKRAK